jgi:hypothetical protein
MVASLTGVLTSLACFGALQAVYPWDVYYDNFQFGWWPTMGSYLFVSVLIGMSAALATVQSRRRSNRSALSPDGLSLAYLTSDGTSVHTAIMLKPLAGGESRELLKLNDGMTVPTWRDGVRMVSRCCTGGAAAQPAAGTVPQMSRHGFYLLGEANPASSIWASPSSQMQPHPDGKHIAFWSNNQTGEQVWVLENVVPSVTAKKQMLVLLTFAVFAIPFGTGPVPSSPGGPSNHTRENRARRELFFDKRLSHDGSVSCASCHERERAFSDGRTIAAGALTGQFARRVAVTP